MDISIKGKDVFHLKKSKFISKNDKEIKRQINKYYHVIPLFSLDFNANQNRSSPLHSTFFLRFLFQKEINPSHASIKKKPINPLKRYHQTWKTLCLSLILSMMEP